MPDAVVMPTKFTVNYWNNSFYCKVVMPDGTTQELKSDEDLTYTQWQEIIKAAWDASQIPSPSPKECSCPKCKFVFVCPNRGL